MDCDAVAKAARTLSPTLSRRPYRLPARLPSDPDVPWGRIFSPRRAWGGQSGILIPIAEGRWGGHAAQQPGGAAGRNRVLLSPLPPPPRTQPLHRLAVPLPSLRDGRRCAKSPNTRIRAIEAADHKPQSRNIALSSPQGPDPCQSGPVSSQGGAQWPCEPVAARADGVGKLRRSQVARRAIDQGRRAMGRKPAPFRGPGSQVPTCPPSASSARR